MRIATCGMKEHFRLSVGCWIGLSVDWRAGLMMRCEWRRCRRLRRRIVTSPFQGEIDLPKADRVRVEWRRTRMTHSRGIKVLPSPAPT